MPGLNEVNLKDFKIELFGTFAQTWFGGWAYVHSVKAANSDTCSVALCHMVIMMLLIWSTYKPTGGHFNPVVTFNMVQFKRLSLYDGLSYFCGQFLGAMLGCSMLKVLCDNTFYSSLDGRIINGFPALIDTIVFWKILILEVIGSFLLMIVVYMTNIVDFKADNVNGPSIGGVYGFLILVSPKNTPIAINPIRALAPALVSADLANWALIWAYVIGPLLGGTLGSLMGEWFSNGYIAEPYSVNAGLSQKELEQKTEIELVSRSSLDIENEEVRQSEILQSLGNVDNIDINNYDGVKPVQVANIDMTDN